MPSRVRIAVIGGGACTGEEGRTAEAVGRGVAARGAILITGGLGGVMAAASKGAREGGGLVVGILPGRRAADANPDVEIPIVTGMGEARNVIVAGSADAVIAVGGQLGTLSEIAFALMRAIPVVGIGTWELDAARHSGPGVIHARDADEAVAKAFAALAGQAASRPANDLATSSDRDV
jgi:uncharacterized protein (TIGR00725 family)